MMLSTKYSANLAHSAGLTHENSLTIVFPQVDIDVEEFKHPKKQRKEFHSGKKGRVSREEGMRYLRSNNRRLEGYQDKLLEAVNSISMSDEALPSSFPTHLPTAVSNQKSLAPVTTTDNEDVKTMDSSKQPTSYPTRYPTKIAVTSRPTNQPSSVTTYIPTSTPTNEPTRVPSFYDKSRDIYPEPSRSFPTSLPTVSHHSSSEIPAAEKFNSSGLLQVNIALFVVTFFIVLVVLVFTVKKLFWDSSSRSHRAVLQQEDIELLVTHERTYNNDDESRIQEKRQRGRKEKF